MREYIIFILIFLSTLCAAQIGYKAPEPPDTVGAGYFADSTGIEIGGGASWYALNTLPTADDTIKTALDLFTVPVTNGTYYIKGRICVDTLYGKGLPAGVTLTGTHRHPNGDLSELYWTEEHTDSLTGSLDANSMFHLQNNNITFIGIKFAGRDTIVSQVDQDRRGFSADGSYSKYVNCEIAYFERNGIDMQGNPSTIDVEYCYIHDCHLYGIIMIRNNSTMNVKGSYFKNRWHATATNSGITGFRYNITGCIFEKITRPHEDIWNQFQYGGRSLADVHPPGLAASGEADVFITYCSFFRQPVNRVLDPWEDGDLEIYDMWIRDDATSTTMDTLIFDHNLMNRPSNVSHGNSYRVDLTPNVSIITNNVVNPHPVK